uniref:M-phase phosphoprotein 6 n=1 Tax=Amazona collaria TaxID=241587 RepID=A0A8B9FSV2_9PSIT
MPVAMTGETKTKLSRNLLRMKFMQKGLDAQTKKELEEEEKKVINDEHWYLDVPVKKAKESFIVEERSFVVCEELLYGRMSFNGFNPEIEKLMIQMNSKNKKEEIEVDDKMEADVSDAEMARSCAPDLPGIGCCTSCLITARDSRWPEQMKTHIILTNLMSLELYNRTLNPAGSGAKNQ